MAKRNQHGLILAGGRGTRFWPRSRKSRPKQLLSLLGERSLIQETVDRLRPVIPPERIWILTGEHLRRQIIGQLPEVPRRQVLAEPAPRNTAPCIGLAAQVVRDEDPDAVLGVFPADQLIGKPGRFRRMLRGAYRGAEKGHLMVMGIQPRWPETGYGYVEFPAGVQPGGLKPAPVVRFREKPDLKTARRFLAAERFYWNSGMFFWRADVFLDALRHYLPKTSALLASLPALTSRRFGARLREVFPLAENISVDYAVLEKAGNVMGLAADDIEWNDLGSWKAIYELLPPDASGSVARGDMLAVDSGGNYVEAPGKLVALVGVDDMIVVDTPDALLVAGRDRAQQVGQIVKLLENSKRDDLL